LLGIVTTLEGEPLGPADLAGRIGGFSDISALEAQPNISDSELIEGLLQRPGPGHELGQAHLGAVDHDGIRVHLAERGLGFAVDLKKPGGFLGRDAVVAQKAAGPLKKRLVQVLVKDPEPMLFHAEVVRRDGTPCGYVRAASYGASICCQADAACRNEVKALRGSPAASSTVPSA